MPTPACRCPCLPAWRLGLATAAFALACTVAVADPPGEDEAVRIGRERAAIQAERERLEAQFAAERAHCAARFAVNACLDDVRERRRAALEGPRARELALDDAERRRRAAVRRETLAQRQREAAERPPPAVLPAMPDAPSAAAMPVPVVPPAVFTQDAEGPTARAAAASAAVEAAAAKRGAAARQRDAAVRAERARIEERKAERARRGKLSAPLPVPAASVPR
jgi:colicin import membrane protein